MTNRPSLRGVYAAAVTPMNLAGVPRPQDVPLLLDFLARRGVHGALLLGTTGEGPSLAPEERLDLMRAASRWRDEQAPDFRLLVGTGTPSLEETLSLTRAAFDLGFDAVVVLPPYYFRNAPEEGLFSWFATLLQRAVPADGAVLAYHIPQVSGVGFSLDLLARLKQAFPDRFVGLKDSSGDPAHAEVLGRRFGDGLLVFTGNDRLLSHALQHHAAGAITALANVAGPLLRRVWEAFQAGQPTAPWQERLDAARTALEAFAPYGPSLKAVLHLAFGFPRWGVKPPLLPVGEEAARTLWAQLAPWLDVPAQG